jgi:hypothetical protein
MQIALIALLLWGQATFYADGVFERVWDYREHTMPACSECVGYAAMLAPEHLGQRVWVSNGSEWIGPLYVIDCADPRDLPDLVAANVVIEVDSWLAEKWNMRGPIEVRVSFRPPAEDPLQPDVPGQWGSARRAGY